MRRRGRCNGKPPLPRLNAASLFMNSALFPFVSFTGARRAPFWWAPFILRLPLVVRRMKELCASRHGGGAGGSRHFSCRQVERGILSYRLRLRRFSHWCRIMPKAPQPCAALTLTDRLTEGTTTCARIVRCQAAFPRGSSTTCEHYCDSSIALRAVRLQAAAAAYARAASGCWRGGPGQ